MRPFVPQAKSRCWQPITFVSIWLLEGLTVARRTRAVHEDGLSSWQRNSLRQTPFSKRVTRKERKALHLQAFLARQGSWFPLVIPSQVFEINQLLQRHRQRGGMCRVEIAMLTSAQIGSEIAFTPLTCFANQGGVVWKIGLCGIRQMQAFSAMWR